MAIDNFKNDTRNQHFVSQAEQRLNSCSVDPYSKKAEIHRFDVVDKKRQQIRSNGKSLIRKNLAFQDLFTFARVGDSERINFERLFNKYEGGYPAQVAGLLDWITVARTRVDVTSESIDLQKIKGCDFAIFLKHVKYIYTYKLMNWLRNPYKIKEVLKNFDSYVDHCIDKPGAFALYVALTEKNNAEEKYICDSYGVSPKEYKEWIRLLLLFLYAEGDESTSLDGFVDEFFLAKEFSTSILAFVFDKKCALLSDTGVIKEPLKTGPAIYMNITKNCIILLQHAFVDGKYLDELMAKLSLPESERERLMEILSTNVYGRLSINDEAMLAGYNKICVREAALQVFCASPDVYGVEVI
ncbi:hypothetical protein ACFFQ5_09920 [Pseudomonas brassicacearum]|jgi:hypothetical protein|uniref:hypothetical protein n=1 Tax=Pseudomonas brassicacearum TaxID=930166 RepID=UPI0005B50086|nr:hypothetical protein [Pseudomonas brassicacearum]KAB0527369.1 hypothetical protein F7R20_07075 [Pseudomonas brassicacearum subsp. brassicacearum]NJP60129.1 hypothetical protein [Pseudomonas brassicacearum]QEO81728.1 hypothetical protein ELZ14_30855 [Pseudomonas brassicacearum]SDP95548.1 hypothetical protein SAMN04490180_4537 [Pseudomonas brassicacearum]